MYVIPELSIIQNLLQIAKNHGCLKSCQLVKAHQIRWQKSTLRTGSRPVLQLHSKKQTSCHIDVVFMCQQDSRQM